MTNINIGSNSFLLIVTMQIASTATMASCPVLKTYKVPDGNMSREVVDTATFVVYRSGLRVNTDGAANSYHPVGTSKGALNTIVNGIGVYPSSGAFKDQLVSAIGPINMVKDKRQQLILDIFRESRDAGYAIPKSGTIRWYALAMEPGPPKVGFYRPCIQTKGPYAGFFVAQTAKIADSTKSVCDPAHWISSTEIPYLTLPNNSSTFQAVGVAVGDLAIVHRNVGGIDRWIPAIVADSGNRDELGEGSIALHHALGNPSKGRIPDNLPADITTFIFKKSAPNGPISADVVTDAKNGLILRAGGASVLSSCLN